MQMDTTRYPPLLRLGKMQAEAVVIHHLAQTWCTQCAGIPLEYQFRPGALVAGQAFDNRILQQRLGAGKPNGECTTWPFCRTLLEHQVLPPPEYPFRREGLAHDGALQFAG